MDNWCGGTCAVFRVAYYLGDLDLAYKLAEYLAIVEAAENSFIAVTFGMFFRALTYNAMYRRSPKRKYRSQTTKILRRMDMMRGKENINFLHKYLIVEADFNATYGLNPGHEKASFDNAILKATRAGFVQDGALANELAGEFSLKNKDEFWAEYYMTKAYTMYETWQARAKTKQLLERHAKLVNLDSAMSEVFVTKRRSRKDEAMSAVSKSSTGENGSSVFSSHFSVGGQNSSQFFMR